MSKLTHINRKGEAAMVDVSAKPPVRREAVAEGRIVLQAATLDLIRKNQIAKGDVLSIARIAGIQAAKQTQHLIPLCHQIPLSKVQLDFEFRPKAVHIIATAITVAPTGVEMEALTAVSIAALTIYDMCKAADKKMRIEGIRLVRKTKG
ncbi:MAG: cyclic pyranopterin monophosphate synthase MoaC [Prosthecobacter sp.]|uniref:cyclic pyranopterin monophosphate synthase MoaC n=1 Tax=Prosthecobacter sp. TaxID=1965333 RepID=UPI003900E483